MLHGLLCHVPALWSPDCSLPGILGILFSRWWISHLSQSSETYSLTPPLPDGGRSGAHHVYTSGTTQRYRCKTLTRTLLGGLTQCTICGSLLQEKLPIHSPQMCMCYQWEKGAPAAIKLLIAEHGDSSETERPSNAYGVVLTLPLPIQNTCTVRRNC